jgi:hypothetical protein
MRGLVLEQFWQTHARNRDSRGLANPCAGCHAEAKGSGRQGPSPDNTINTVGDVRPSCYGGPCALDNFCGLLEKVETFSARNVTPQCKRYQRYRHTQRNCGYHLAVWFSGTTTNLASVTPKQQLRCCSCGGNITANHGGCSCSGC